MFRVKSLFNECEMAFPCHILEPRRGKDLDLAVPICEHKTHDQHRDHMPPCFLPLLCTLMVPYEPTQLTYAVSIGVVYPWTGQQLQQP